MSYPGIRNDLIILEMGLRCVNFCWVRRGDFCLYFCGVRWGRCVVFGGAGELERLWV